MDEITRVTEGRCVLVAFSADGPGGKAYAADVLAPEGLFPPGHLRRCDAYGLWRAGLFLEETDGLKQLTAHETYDPVALREDLRSLTTLLGQGVSLLTHLEQGCPTETWEQLPAEQARDLFRRARAEVVRLGRLVDRQRAEAVGVVKPAQISKQGAADAVLQPQPEAKGRTPMSDQANAKPQPLYKLTTEGAARAAIWLNQKGATQEEYFTVSFYRCYRDRQGQWQNSYSFRPQDLEGVNELAERAQAIIRHEQSLRQGRERQAGHGPEANRGPEVER